MRPFALSALCLAVLALHTACGSSSFKGSQKTASPTNKPGESGNPPGEGDTRGNTPLPDPGPCRVEVSAPAAQTWDKASARVAVVAKGCTPADKPKVISQGTEVDVPVDGQTPVHVDAPLDADAATAFPSHKGVAGSVGGVRVEWKNLRADVAPENAGGKATLPVVSIVQERSVHELEIPTNAPLHNGYVVVNVSVFNLFDWQSVQSWDVTDVSSDFVKVGCKKLDRKPQVNALPNVSLSTEVWGCLFLYRTAEHRTDPDLTVHRQYVGIKQASRLATTQSDIAAPENVHALSLCVVPAQSDGTRDTAGGSCTQRGGRVVVENIHASTTASKVNPNVFVSAVRPDTRAQEEPVMWTRATALVPSLVAAGVNK